MSAEPHDPLDTLATLGYRVVFVPDFDDRVVLVRSVNIVMIDPALGRQSAADAALSLLAPPHLGLPTAEAS